MALIFVRLRIKEKKIPVEWINEAGNGVKEELITYLPHWFRAKFPVSMRMVCQVY